MKSLKLLVAAALLLSGCAGLPRSVKEDIATESDKLDQANKQLQNTRKAIQDAIAKNGDLFNGTPVVAEWPARLNAAKTKLDRAGETRKDLERLHSADRDTLMKAERMIADEREQRLAAVNEVARVQGEADRWLDFQRNLPQHLSMIQQAHDRIKSVDVGPVALAVEKAERDWPAKKADLESRLNAIRSAPDKAEQQWQATADVRAAAAAGKATGAQLATLIEADTVLSDAAADTNANARNLQALSGQLYDSWDKILEDLDATGEGRNAVYREKLKTVRTHYIDVPSKKTETTSDEKWVDVSPSAYRSVERDLGMAISHKDAGFYDSEAQNVAQPAGFAYIAPPEVGRNQYGYWTHNESGSFWTFLPEYLIMRELLWGRGGYQPIVINEYNSYYTAQRAGRSYYGQESPQAPPKYGSHGTFTQQRYSGSRYVQSGGYKSSGYASSPSAPVAAPAQRFGSAPTSDPSQGKRFGGSAEPPSSQGRRFGSGGGASEPPAGRRFGSGGSSPRPSAPRMAPRGFGSRRR